MSNRHQYETILPASAGIGDISRSGTRTSPRARDRLLLATLFDKTVNAFIELMDCNNFREIAVRRHFFMGVLLLLPVFAFAASPQAPQASPQDACIELSANLLQNLQKGDFTAATTHFDDFMKAGLGAQKLKQIWQQYLPKKFGTFEGTATPKTIHNGSLNVAVTPLKFVKGWVNWVVSCNAKAQIDGLHFHPGAPPGGVTTEASPSGTA